jgi:hypothetical protein
MAAGLGFKDFTTGEVLTAADVDGYLMQGIWVFASTAARDAAVTAPAEGNFAFTKDTNSLWYYDGAAWVASGATGDIEGVTAGVGISGGGTSGTVTITNSMATAIDAKGDLVAGTGADTFSRLAVGTNDQVLIADSTAATGLKWGTPSSGAFTLLTTTTMSGSTTTISSINQTYKHLYVQLSAVTCAASAGEVYLQTGSGSEQEIYVNNTTWGHSGGALHIFNGGLNTGGGNGVGVWIYGYSSTTRTKPMIAFGGNYNSSSAGKGFLGAGCDLSTGSAISSLSITCSGTTWTGGTVQVYGVN